jgi:hypothetical protein
LYVMIMNRHVSNIVNVIEILCVKYVTKNGIDVSIVRIIKLI